MDLPINCSWSLPVASFALCFIAFLLIDIVFFRKAGTGWPIIPALSASVATGAVTCLVSRKKTGNR